MDIDEVLYHFNDVKATGNTSEFMARCPCHDDKVRSLCIGIDNAGKILIKCQAGCETKNILEAVGLKFSDLFPDNAKFKRKQKSEPELSSWKSAAEKYEYRNGNRKLKWQDRKTGKKTACSWDHKEKDGQWYKGRNTEKNYLYLAGGLKDLKQEEIVVVAEGEKDAERLWKTVCIPAVSCEHGAKDWGNGWLKTYTEELQNKTVYVFQDNDDIGKEFARYTCDCLSGAVKNVYLIDLSEIWPEIKEHNDYSDFCDAVGDSEAAEKVLKFMETLKPFDPEKDVTEREKEIKSTKFPVELHYGKYSLSESGVSRVEYDDEGNAEYEPVCAHPIIPIQILRNIETGEERVTVWYRVAGYEREIPVAGSKLFSSQKIIELADYGVSVSSTTARAMVNYFRETIDGNRKIIPVQKSVSHMGWVENDGFVPYDTSIVYDGDVAFQAAVDAIHTEGDFEVWKKEAGACRAYSKEVRLITAAAFASPMIEPLGAMIFFTHIWGVSSGTGKTVALMVAASIYGDPEIGGGYAVSLNSTAVSMERRAALLRNLPFCGDEAQTLRVDNRGNRIFDPYKLSEGVSKDRSNISRGLDRMSKWACTFITTGETPLLSENDPAGAQNRILEIECPPGQKLVEDGFTTANILRNNYGYAGRKWIKYLQRPGVIESMQNRVTDISKVLISEYDITDKQAQAGALIIAADERAVNEFWPDEMPLGIDDIIQYLKTEEIVDTGKRAYDFVCNWVIENSHKFISEIGLDADAQGPRKNETYGIIRRPDAENIMYVDILKKAFDSACGEGGYNPKALLTWLKSKDKIVTTKYEGDLTNTQKINGKTARVVRMEIPADPRDTEAKKEEFSNGSDNFSFDVLDT